MLEIVHGNERHIQNNRSDWFAYRLCRIYPSVRRRTGCHTHIYNDCGNDECELHLRSIRLVWSDLDIAATRKALKRTTFVDRLKVFAFKLATPLIIGFLFKRDSRDKSIESFNSNWTNPKKNSKFEIFWNDRQIHSGPTGRIPRNVFASAIGRPGKRGQADREIWLRTSGEASPAA